MAETYCGKNCAECGRREELACPGCKAGPGRSFGGGCELAQCARGKGHETCDTCIFKGNCGTLRGRDRIPDRRIRAIAAEQQRKAAIARRAPVLGKWLWLIVAFTAVAGEHTITEFLILTRGDAYCGVYYSPDDVPAAFQNVSAELMQDGHDDWVWKAEGDNHSITSRIQDRWYCFEASF